MAVVIPTFRRPHGLATLITALERQSLPASDFEVVMVDDCSGDGTVEHLRTLARATSLDLQVLETASNEGPAAARNLGWKHSAAEVVAFLDDDCMPESTWLEAGVAAVRSGHHLGVVQGRTTAPEGTTVWGLNDWWLWRIIERAGPYFEACNIFYRRCALEVAGGFEEEPGWWGWFGEDTAAGWGVVDHGWERGFAAGAVVVHGLERRGWRWFATIGLREENFVRLATRHPGFRTEAFWRPWAYRRSDAAFVGALAGLVAARWWRPALGAALPYLWLQRPSVRRPGFFRLCWQIPAVDAARLVGHLTGSFRYRTLVV